MARGRAQYCSSFLLVLKVTMLSQTHGKRGFLITPHKYTVWSWSLTFTSTYTPSSTPPSIFIGTVGSLAVQVKYTTNRAIPSNKPLLTLATHQYSTEHFSCFTLTQSIPVKETSSLAEAQSSFLQGQSVLNNKCSKWGRLWLSANPRAVERRREEEGVGRTLTITTVITEKTNWNNSLQGRIVYTHSKINNF